MVIKKECTCIPRKCKPFWLLITLLAYFAISRNGLPLVEMETFLFIKN